MGSNLSIGKLHVALHTSGSLTTAVENEKGKDRSLPSQSLTCSGLLCWDHYREYTGKIVGCAILMVVFGEGLGRSRSDEAVVLVSAWVAAQIMLIVVFAMISKGIVRAKKNEIFDLPANIVSSSHALYR
ncbi:hypothetical protein WN944_018405 [Citrus x changshan-huyou]|uniref:Uncharacterized protein n=1 Tax=Citrus x changshan-huyou TaxID=2935761 RepID=A0AAP0LWR1_9ROSI